MCDGAEMKIELGMTMEVGYNAYAGRMNMSLPHTEKHLKTQVTLVTLGTPAEETHGKGNSKVKLILQMRHAIQLERQLQTIGPTTPTTGEPITQQPKTTT